LYRGVSALIQVTTCSLKELTPVSAAEAGRRGAMVVTINDEARNTQVVAGLVQRCILDGCAIDSSAVSSQGCTR